LSDKKITPPGITAQKMTTIQTYDPHGRILVTSNDTFTTEGFSGSGTIEDPYKLEWKNITSSSGNLIEIRNTTAYFIICNNLLNGLNQGGGILLSNVTHGIIENNSAHNIFQIASISVEYSSNNTISDNTVFNCHLGIAIMNSNKIIISDNNVYDCQAGIEIGGSNSTTIDNNTFSEGGIGIWSSTNNTISNNTVSNIDGSGIGLDGSTNHTISNNIVHNCYQGINPFGHGINLGDSNHNNISNNVIYNCQVYGIAIGGFKPLTNYNTITNNDLSGNCQDEDYYGEPQANDDGSDNIFVNNYWSDWTGTGSYTIFGDAGNQDPSPLTNPYHLSAPDITAPTSDTPTLKDSVIIKWTASTDLFGHTITYSVLYSPNDGINWTLLTSGLIITSYTLDTTIITDGTSILLKVQAIDSIGFIAQSTSNETFLILNGVSPPIVKVPNGGETLEGTVTIEWVASLDPFEHTITYSVYYSSDNGATWTQLTSDLTSTSYSWDTTTVPDGLSYLIKVVAICSEGETSEDVSDSTFAIQNLKKTTSEASGIPILIFLLALVVRISVRKRKKS
jgi:parallel beta-helix repeat protein